MPSNSPSRKTLAHRKRDPKAELVGGGDLLTTWTIHGRRPTARQLVSAQVRLQRPQTKIFSKGG
jgi:hypothetical protein